MVALRRISSPRPAATTVIGGLCASFATAIASARIAARNRSGRLDRNAGPDNLHVVMPAST
jgi:hypothetical protein